MPACVDDWYDWQQGNYYNNNYNYYYYNNNAWTIYMKDWRCIMYWSHFKTACMKSERY